MAPQRCVETVSTLTLCFYIPFVIAAVVTLSVMVRRMRLSLILVGAEDKRAEEGNGTYCVTREENCTQGAPIHLEDLRSSIKNRKPHPISNERASTQADQVSKSTSKAQVVASEIPAKKVDLVTKSTSKPQPSHARKPQPSPAPPIQYLKLWDNSVTRSKSLRLGRSYYFPRPMEVALKNYKVAGMQFAGLLHEAAKPHCYISAYAGRKYVGDDRWRYFIREPKHYTTVARLLAERAPRRITMEMLVMLRTELMCRMMADDWHEAHSDGSPQRQNKDHQDFTAILGETGQILMRAYVERKPRSKHTRFEIDGEVEKACQQVWLKSYEKCLQEDLINHTS